MIFHIVTILCSHNHYRILRLCYGQKKCCQQWFPLSLPPAPGNHLKRPFFCRWASSGDFVQRQSHNPWALVQPDVSEVDPCSSVCEDFIPADGGQTCRPVRTQRLFICSVMGRTLCPQLGAIVYLFICFCVNTYFKFACADLKKRLLGQIVITCWILVNCQVVFIRGFIYYFMFPPAIYEDPILPLLACLFSDSYPAMSEVVSSCILHLYLPKV